MSMCVWGGGGGRNVACRFIKNSHVHCHVRNIYSHVEKLRIAWHMLILRNGHVPLYICDICKCDIKRISRGRNLYTMFFLIIIVKTRL